MPSILLVFPVCEFYLFIILAVLCISIKFLAPLNNLCSVMSPMVLDCQGPRCDPAAPRMAANASLLHFLGEWNYMKLCQGEGVLVFLFNGLVEGKIYRKP